MAATLFRASSLPTLRRFLTTKKQVISVAGKEFKAVNDVFPIDNDFILHKESLEKQVARDSIINSDVSPQDIALVSGMPEEHTTTRRVRVFKEAKNAMQSGNKNTYTWKLDFENRERWENPLMGWTSTGDPISNLSLKFNSLEEAIAFCEKNTWFYTVDEPPEPRKPKKKSYADNFSWNKRTRVGSK
ncbi:NADH dehydrogenase [ubiquinone] iron-sulfur protein 4, mitochondrial-like [Panonychus citri]|uniref:NADH dehydrogenase [ubiquinone] iron-sulfur protein 4, mitochondrial-like n=1 Tax=Panonychus citri TaxID=50023 RepID=UPI002307C063|nr:NADH dehydrogenase [ubiquinone] iron-sulfur protein 4, mitochondrial-like [Panonychus citri]XP_053214561.1 NADH dehydrogenase [ubiquinone] iron-sulfur protein 4, mitochondrial-like [Panonychus citri]